MAGNLTPMTTVLMPASAPIREAAAWVGSACWTELAVFEAITGWLAVESQPTALVVLWAVRADRAIQAEVWHDRLPELREMPRAHFVKPSGRKAVNRMAALDALSDPGATAARVVALDGVLGDLFAGYTDHQGVAVGPADGPTASALTEALGRLHSDRMLLGQLRRGGATGRPRPLP